MPVHQDKSRRCGLAIKNCETVIITNGGLRYVCVCLSISLFIVSLWVEAVENSLPSQRGPKYSVLADFLTDVFMEDLSYVGLDFVELVLDLFAELYSYAETFRSHLRGHRVLAHVVVASMANLFAYVVLKTLFVVCLF